MASDQTDQVSVMFRGKGKTESGVSQISQDYQACLAKPKPYESASKVTPPTGYPQSKTDPRLPGAHATENLAMQKIKSKQSVERQTSETSELIPKTR